MINSAIKDGKHCEVAKEYTDEELKLMRSQDLKYVTYKRNVELKKIDKLKASLHLLDVDKPPNKHVFFTESKKKATKEKIAKRLNTHPDLLGRTYNLPRLDKLKHKKLFAEQDLSSMSELAVKRDQMYSELMKRTQRASQLSRVLEKMTMEAQLMVDYKIPVELFL